MAKTKQIKIPSDIRHCEECESLGKPIDELKGNDYSALSYTLLQKGEFRLLDGDKGGIEYFEMALKLDSKNPKLYLDQGLALFEYGSREESEEGLILASKRFKVATSLDPYNFQAWHLWGNTLYFLGQRRKEPSYYANALQKYEKALELSGNQPPDVQADLYWDIGDLWSILAEKSGEITDYSYAIKAYEKASFTQDDLAPEFWISFGNVYQTVGEKTNDTRFIIKGVNAYKNAVSSKLSFSEGWFLLGYSMKTLYLYSHDEDHFSQANECFATAVQLENNVAKNWLEWGRLLLESAILTKDIKKIHASIDKCYKAYRIEKKNPFTIAVWVEALALLGSLTEKLEPIHEALGKIESLIERSPNTETYYAYGMCFHALGNYYNDLDYYYQALEQFQEGLSINRNKHHLWYAMALSSQAAAELDHEEKSYERSLHFFEKALHLKKLTVYYSHYAKCLLRCGEIFHNKETLSHAVFYFEKALARQRNAPYLHTDWIFSYASSLDQLAGFEENSALYTKAIDLLNHILMSKPEFPQIHFQLALTYSHYAELVNEPDLFYRAIHYYRIAHQKENENDQIILDWALTLMNLGELLENEQTSDELYREAEHKMIQAAKFGNIHAYYSLSCLYSVIGDLDNSLRLLEKAKVFEALPPLEELLEDDWLDNLRETEGFRSFLSTLESNTK
jgi:tetratricopeptide (TPR) repeat protein